MKRLFLFLSFVVVACVGVRGQVTIVNYDFNVGTNYLTLTPILASNITSTASSTESFLTYAGTATAGLAFTNNVTAGNALGMSNSSGTNTKYFQFQLGGSSLNKCSSYKLYFQSQRSNTGATTITLAYSTDNITYTNFGTTAAPGNGNFTETVLDLSAISALDNQSQIYFRLMASGASGVGTLRIDNFQIQTVLATTNFYSKATGNLTDVATWGTNTDGTGTQPGDFITDAQIFNVVNRASVTLDANWTVSGAASKVIVGDGLSPTILILPATAALSGTVDVSSISTLQIVNTSLPTFGILANNSTVDYAQTTTPYVVPTGSTYHHLKLTGNTKTFASGAVSVNGNLVVDGVSNFNGAAWPFTTMNIGGNFSLVNSSTFEPNPAGDGNRMTVTCNGTGTQTFSGGDFYLFRVQTPAAGTVSIALNSANLSLGNTSGGGLNLLQATHTLSIGAGNTLTFHGAGYISSSNVGFLSGTTTSNLVVDKTAGTLAPGTLQFISGGQLLNNLNYNCTAPVSNTTLVLATPVALSGNLTMISGNIDIGANDISVTGAATGAATSYIKTSSTGLLKLLNVTSLRNSPIGNSTYNPVTVTSTDGYDWSTRVEDVLQVDDPIFQPNATGAVKRQWYAYPSVIPPATNAVVTFQYNDGDATQIGATFGINKSVQVWRKVNSGSPWGADWVAVNTTQMPTGSPGSDRTATTYNWNTFSNLPFAVSNLDAPLTLNCIISIRAEKRSNAGFIYWDVNTCSEVNSFELQRSVNGGVYQTIQTVRPAGSNETSFSYNDAQTGRGRNLYRIKINGINGEIKYSNIAALLFDSNELLITSVWPNPATEVVRMTLSAARQQPVSFAMYNSMGIIVKKWNTAAGDGNTIIETNVAALPSGVYHIIAVSGDARASVQFVK